MKIKDTKGKKAEMVFLITAAVLTGLLLVYVVWLVRTLVVKSDAVFAIDTKAGSGVPTFNFEKYEKLFGPIPSSTPSITPTKPASSTPSSTMKKADS